MTYRAQKEEMMMYHNKVKSGLSLTQDCLDLLENNKDIDGAGSKNELAERAIRFYIAYKNSEQHTDFLSKVLTDASKDALKETENRIASIAFKMAVESAMINLCLIDLMEMSDGEIKKYRKKAIGILKETQGFLSLDRAKKFQAAEIFDKIRLRG